MQYPRRKRIRLKTHDYAQNGMYFVTVCIKDKASMLGVLCITKDGPIIQRSSYGRIVDECVAGIEEHHAHVKLRRYVLMPDHIHLLVQIHNLTDIQATETSASLSEIIKGFKRITTKKIGLSIWQDSFYERIIKDRETYMGVCRYIEQNPRKWAENPVHSRIFESNE